MRIFTSNGELWNRSLIDAHLEGLQTIKTRLDSFSSIINVCSKQNGYLVKFVISKCFM